MSMLGTLERGLGQRSADRWAVALVVVAPIVALAWIGCRRGWHRAVAQRPWSSALAAAVALAIAIVLGGDVLRPLWTGTELNEASPIEAAAGVEAATIVAECRFRGADEFHFGEGTGRVLGLADGAAMGRCEDVSVRNGPDRTSTFPFRATPKPTPTGRSLWGNRGRPTDRSTGRFRRRPTCPVTRAS